VIDTAEVNLASKYYRDWEDLLAEEVISQVVVMGQSVVTMEETMENVVT
jgi:hypothetical protein